MDRISLQHVQAMPTICSPLSSHRDRKSELASAVPDELRDNSRIINCAHMFKLGSSANSLRMRKIKKRDAETHS